MNQQTFELELKEGKLIIPDEIQDYLTHFSEPVKISLTIESRVNLADVWSRWFEEVEKIEPICNNPEIDDYEKPLIDKYKKQGLEL